MAQLVLVHGVATRSGDVLEATELNTRQLFEKAVFPPESLHFYTPHWGDLVPSVPGGVFETDADMDSFAVAAQPEDDGFSLGGEGAGRAGSISIGEVATRHPILAIDAVLAALVDEATSGRDPRSLTPEEIDLFVRAVDMAADPAEVARLAGSAGSDGELADMLAPDRESYALGLDVVGRAIGRVTDRIGSLTSGLAWGLVRDSIRPAVGLFSGDVFAYLNNGDLRAGIREAVGADIRTAWQARKSDEPFILVGHSMGGVILTDMLSDPAAAGLPADLTVDCLFTVGSQPGLFQAVGALGGGAPQGGGRLSRREWIHHWFNVFDPIDPLAFAAAPIFDGVVDVAFDSIAGVASAHTTYFKRPQFYARFRERLGELDLLR